MPHPPTILIYGNDATLIDTRRWVLEKAGFQVATVAEIAAAEAIVAQQPVDLLLLCHTLTPDQRQTALATAATLRPEMKRLVMITYAQEVGQEEIAGDTIHIFAGAQALIAATRNLLN